MAYVFVSHASPDKRSRVRPLVEALLKENIKVWVDRPGVDGDGFGFSRDFINQNDIGHIHSGQFYHQAIEEAIRQSGAVLVCLSRSFIPNKLILAQETLLARTQNKLVACLVDDLPHDQIPADLGLVDGQKIQAVRIDTDLLRQAVAALDCQEVAGPDDLPPLLQAQWEVLRNLKEDIMRLFPDLPAPTRAEWQAAQKALAGFPVTPMIRAFEIPSYCIELMAERFSDSDKASQFVNLAMNLRLEVNPETGTTQQIIVSEGERLPIKAVTPQEYWTSFMVTAGQKSPRTLAALFVAPGAVRLEQLPEVLRGRILVFLDWLRNPKQST